MNSSRPQRFYDWQQLAQQVEYSVSALAKACGVSVRTLERRFPPALGDTPGRCLRRLRMHRAIELLRDGSTVKETSACLCYRDPSHFSREFRREYGLAPKEYRNLREARKYRIRP